MKTYSEFMQEAILSSVIKAVARQAFKSGMVKQAVKAIPKATATIPTKIKVAPQITGFQTGRGSKYTYERPPQSFPQTQRTAPKDPYHPTPEGTKQKSDWTLFTTPDASMQMRQKFMSGGSDKPFYHGLPQSTTPKKGRAPVEVWNQYKEKGGRSAIHPGSPIVDIQTRTGSKSNLPLFGAEREEIRRRVKKGLKAPNLVAGLRKELGMIPKS